MSRINQIVALVKGKKGETKSSVTKVYHLCQKPDLFSGFVKTYEPKDEDGDRYPNDEKRLQLRVEEVLTSAFQSLNVLFNVVEIQDIENCTAMADVRVNDTVILKGVPPTYLMFLEKQLTDMFTFLNAIPTLDLAKDWEYSEDTRCYRSKPIERHKTKKVVRYDVASPATKEHPAQISKEYEDIVEGYWTTSEFSGAATEERKHELIERVRKLKEAVVSAREEANSTQITREAQYGKAIVDFILN